MGTPNVAGRKCWFNPYSASIIGLFFWSYNFLVCLLFIRKKIWTKHAKRKVYQYLFILLAQLVVLAYLVGEIHPHRESSVNNKDMAIMGITFFLGLMTSYMFYRHRPD